MRERFRHPQGNGNDLLIGEFPSPTGSVWALVESPLPATGGTGSIICEGASPTLVITECAQRLTARFGGRPASWEAVIRETMEPTF